MITAHSSPRVLIIILNWNGSSDTLACLDSLSRVTYPAFDVVVIDNDNISTDNPVARIRQAFPDVPLIETGDNLGFVGGNNLGLVRARANGYDYALLLNNDTEVDPGFLTCLVETAEADPQVGIVGPSIYYFDLPTTFWTAGGKIDWKRGVTSMIGLNEPDTGQFAGAPHPVDFVTGCALLIKMSVVEKLGMLDPRFFLYYEETEWCVRVRRAGYQVMFAPAAKIWHKISPVAREASPNVHYYMTRNRLLFLRLADASLECWLNTALDYARTLLSWTLRPKWRGKVALRRAMLRGIRDYSRGRFGKVDVNGRA